MSTITTRELVDRGAAAADVEDNFVTPAQSGYWLSQENLALSLFLARSGWSQNMLTTTITVAGTEAGAFNLSVSPLAIVAVHQVRNSRCRLLTYTNVVDFLRQTPGATVARGDPSEYRVIWDQANDRLTLNFYPEPTVGTVLVVTYIPEPSKLTLSVSPPAGFANSVKYPQGWEERIVLGWARRALVKEESDTTEIRRMIAECDSMIEEAVWNRVLSESPTIRNVDAVRRGWEDKIVYPPFSQWWVG